MDSTELLRILDEIKNLRSYLESFVKVEESEPYCSKEIHEIAASLAKSRLKFIEIGVNRKSIDGNVYPDLPYIISRVEAALAENGISLYQYTAVFNDSSTTLYTKLIHSSGQWLSSRIKVILTGTDKENDRTLQINKRTQVLVILGIYPNEDLLDDNGDQQAEEKILGEISTPFQAPDKKRNKETITKEQYEELIYTLEGYPNLAKSIKERYNIATLKDMPKENFILDLEKIRKLKLEIQSR